MNESFADFSETIWNEHEYGQDKGDEKNYDDMQNIPEQRRADKFHWFAFIMLIKKMYLMP